MKNDSDLRKQLAPRDSGPLRVVIIVANSNTLVDVLGPYQIFLQASCEGGTPYGEELGRYAIEVVSPGPELLVAARGGIGLQCTSTLDSIEGEIDTLVVAGAIITPGHPVSVRVNEWLRRHAGGIRRIASVCTGAFLLAEAGLLDGRRATTHWRYSNILAQRYPAVIVDPDPIYVQDGNVYTSAGMTSGMDLALALVEEDYGREVALSVARSMVIYLRRPGGQAQFSVALRRQTEEDSLVNRVQHWIAEHLDEALSVERLSEIAGMSPRNFARVFVRDVGTTPAKFVEELRLEEARRMLQHSDETIERVAVSCGFGSVDTLQRHFAESYGTTPTEFRRRFQSALRK